MIRMNSPSCDVEVWKPIPGYEGIYEASNLGKIRSAFGKTTVDKNGVKKVWEQRELKPKVGKRKSGKKDKRVSLWKNGEESTQLVARLVAMAFLDIPYDKLTVNHINGNTMDNRIENLEWVTLAENIQHGFATGLYKSSQKAVVLEDKDGNQMRFESMADASKYLGRSHSYVSEVISGCHYCYDIKGERYTVALDEGGVLKS